MKTLIGCLIFALIGTATAYSVNQRRYGQYEPAFGPMDFEGKVTSTNAMDVLSEQWTKNHPKIELPGGNTHDFGVMSPGDEGEHVFVVKNVGNDDLSLKVGASTCKCTVGELGQESLAPGEETEVTMSWTVKTNENTFGQSAELRTNDPSQVAIRFEIKGKVVRQVNLVPETVTFGEVAAGETIEVEAELFTFIDENLSIASARLGDDEANALTDIQVTSFEPSDVDGVNEAANQAFRVKATIAPGLKQGPVSQNIVVELASDQAKDDSNSEDGNRFVFVPVSGRIVGALSMLTSSRLKGVSGGGYIFDFGKLKPDGDFTAKSFVVLKGLQQKDTKLSIGEISPEGVVEASLAEPIARGKMTLYTLEMKLNPQAEKVERKGMDRTDYGFVMIESNNPKVPALKLRLKFSLPAR